MMSNEDRSNYSFQKVAVAVGVLLFLIKVAAWYLTNSVAILTDALESIVNILAGSFTLYSLYLSALPQDRNHPHGHGKIEFISASVEGTLIVGAGILIIYEAIKRLILQDGTPSQLNMGIILLALTGIINYVVGYIAVKRGSNSQSLALIAGGKHLQSDAYSTVGLILGLFLIILTGWNWIDGAVALLFGGIIIFTGLKILRESIAGIMDEADEDLLERFVEELNEGRSPYWVDIHKVRFIKYGNHMHLDCHLTLPWYLTVRDAHLELDKLYDLMEAKFGERFEMFVHSDDCQPLSCEVCALKDCVQREKRFIGRVEWNRKNITVDKKHGVEDINTEINTDTNLPFTDYTSES